MVWYGEFSVRNNIGYSEQAVNRIHESLDRFAPTLEIGRGETLGRLSVDLSLEGAESFEDALKMTQEAFGAVSEGLEGATLVKIEVYEESLLLDRLSESRSPNLVSISEVAEIGGYSKERARQLSLGEGFPPPWVQTKTVTLWDKSHVEAYFMMRGKRKVKEYALKRYSKTKITS